MRIRRVTSRLTMIVVLLGGSLGPAHLAAQDEEAGQDKSAEGDSLYRYDPRSINLKVLVQGDSPLPYQAVRLRLQVSNVTDKAVDNLCPPIYCMSPTVRYKGDEHLSLALTRHSRESPAAEPFQPRLKSPYVLAPRTSVSVSSAYTGNVQSGKPLFPKPGKYTFRFQYPQGREVYVPVFVAVEVPAAEGDDQRVLGFMEQHPGVTASIHSPVHRPSREFTTTLEALVDLAPKSSYDNYVRFALARAYAHGFGGAGIYPDLRDHDVFWLRRLDELYPKRWQREVVDTLADEFLASHRYVDRLRELVERWKRPAAEGRRADRVMVQKRRNEEILRGIQDLRRLERRDAIAMLETIESPTFPFRPHVLVLRVKLFLAEMNDESYRTLGGELHFTELLEFAFSLGPQPKLVAWFDELTSTWSDAEVWHQYWGYMTKEDWTDFRQNKLSESKRTKRL